jgi:hypothetical protein
MKFKTRSGSMYEVNTDAKRFRLVDGTQPELTVAGREGRAPKGAWKQYERIHGPVVGQRCTVVWGDTYTSTSQVVEISL